MDEVLEYITKASAVKVVESSLAAQTIAFMQELTELACNLERVSLVVTLPASIIEYNEQNERFLQQLQKVAGRVEKIYTPVQENEITKIIRQRLFSEIKQKEIKKVVTEFIDYAEKESIIPPDLQPSEYRDRFLDSYPFMPIVIDTLYHRWGSFHTFQRTRGVLRLLSLVIHSLKDSDKPYISLSDFDLLNQDIRQEFLKHIGAEYNSVIASDITDTEAGSKKVDVSLGGSYRGLKLGTRTSTAIFLCSFSGGHEQGVTLGELKRCATTVQNPSSVVSEAAEQLKNKLFYLQNTDDKYFFSNKPNLNRILLNKMENIKDEDLFEMEKELLKKNIKVGKFKVYIWEENTSNIEDTETLKLIILGKEDKDLIENIYKNKGQTPRVCRNTMFFLYPLETERAGFIHNMKRKIGYEQVQKDKNLSLSDDQKKDIDKELKRIESGLKESVRRLYRTVLIPDKSGFKESDLGIPTYGEDKSLNQEVYDKLRSDMDIVEKIAPLVIKTKYITDKEYVYTDQIYQSSLKTPGEARLTDKEVLEKGISEGVSMGFFGLGEIENDNLICHYFKKKPSISFSSNEVIINEILCKELMKKEEEPKEIEFPEAPACGKEKNKSFSSKTVKVEAGKSSYRVEESQAEYKKRRENVKLKFEIPKGKVAGIMGIMNLLHNKFNILEIQIIAKDGEISESDYEDKIMETFSQLGIDFEEE